jgi:hypothetical protein
VLAVLVALAGAPWQFATTVTAKPLMGNKTIKKQANQSRKARGCMGNL